MSPSIFSMSLYGNTPKANTGDGDEQMKYDTPTVGLIAKSPLAQASYA